MTSDPSASQAAFDQASLLAEAQAKTGFKNFGEDAFLEPLGVLLKSLSEEADLNDLGRTIMRSRVLESLETRLKTEDWITRHPEILEEVIGPPIVVVGLMRTGTTMLQRILSSDPRHYGPMWWEVRFPAPDPGTDFSQLDPRVPRAEAEVAAILEADPGQAAIHPWDAQAPDEEIMLLEHSFLSHVPESFAEMPTYFNWINEQDWTPSYTYLRKFLQFLQWQKRQRGEIKERWILKTPGHLGYIDTLFSVFPGARVVQTHRDPIETVPSAASMSHSIRALYSDGARSSDTGRQWQKRLSWGTERCMASRAKLPKDTFADIWFKDALTNPLAEIERVYEIFGIEMIPEARAAMEQWLVDNRRDKRPAHRYTLEDFGLTEASIREDFAAYRTKFIDPRL